MEGISKVLLDQLLAIFLSACFGSFVSWIAWMKGYFSLPKHLGDNHALRLKSVLMAFGIFLVIGVIVVPGIYAIWVFWEKGSFMHSTEIKLSPESHAWANLAIIMSTGLALMIYYKSLKKSEKEAVWGSSSSNKNFNLETAVQDNKVMQDFDLESLSMGPDHSQTVKAAPIESDYGSKDCVNLLSSTAVSRFKQNAADFLMGSLTWVIAYPWIVVVGQLLAVLIAFIYSGPLPDQVAVKHLKDLSQHPILFSLTALAVFSLVPMIEELLFRGFLQSWLKNKMNRFQAIILTSLIFASFHFSSSQGIENIEFVFSLFLLSCFLGFIKERQQSLWASIGLHSTFNFISILMIIF